MFYPITFLLQSFHHLWFPPCESSITDTTLPERCLRCRSRLQKLLLHHFTNSTFIFLGCSSEFGGSLFLAFPILPALVSSPETVSSNVLPQTIQKGSAHKPEATRPFCSHPALNCSESPLIEAKALCAQVPLTGESTPLLKPRGAGTDDLSGHKQPT